ncbi:MAG: hypothetical protein J6O71_03160 [Lachnospiraceae bacterium]|nr:hypothetical protein [Lachnospiraceae bacterium]
MRNKLFKKICAAAIAVCMLMLSGGCTYEDAANLGLSEADIAELTKSIPGLESLEGVETGEAAVSNAENLSENVSSEDSAEQPAELRSSLSHEGYSLEQVVVLSRHNIRSPLSGGDSLLGTITPHEWFNWSSNASELSLRGGVLETTMGQYFKKWLESEGLFPQNYRPSNGAVRFYANAKQRTIATSEYFSAGLLPTANAPVEYHTEFDTMDPVFNPQLTFMSDAYDSDIRDQVNELFSKEVLGLEDNYALLTEVTDMKDSAAYKDKTVGDLKTDDTELVLEAGSEPAMKGSLKTACSISDALVLQYYEESDPVKAAFGHELTPEQWDMISEIKDVYVDVLFTSPLTAYNVAHPLLEEILSEMSVNYRDFTFLCGHDSNVGSVLAALQAEDYSLPYTIEKKTPIGCKLVFGKWRGKDGKEYMSIDMIYQTTDQLRGLTLLDMDNPPAIYPISLEGLEKNADGLYNLEDVQDRFTEAINVYNAIVQLYAQEEEKAA